MYKETFISATDARFLALAIFLLMGLAIFSGRKVAGRKLQEGKPELKKEVGILLTALLGLLGLLLAFTFGMSGSRYDVRRGHVVSEANAIGTAIYLADLYPEEDRRILRENFRNYLETRISYYEEKQDINIVYNTLKQSDLYAAKLWNHVSALSHRQEYFLPTIQMAPALTKMFDISTSRRIGELSKVPDSVVILLIFVSVITAFFLGYSTSLDNFSYTIFCLLTSMIIYITLDLDRSRRGLIQLDISNEAIKELRMRFEND